MHSSADSKNFLLKIKPGLNKRLEADHMLLASMQSVMLPCSRKALSVPFQCWRGQNIVGGVQGLDKVQECPARKREAWRVSSQNPGNMPLDAGTIELG